MTRIDAPDFWKWAFSDFMSNALRGVLAEYIVATAVGCVSPRTEWDAYDLVTEDDLKIEVKSSAYLQAWEQKKHSAIRFDIAPKKSWDAKTNTASAEAVRSAGIYVFCVFSETNRSIAAPLNLDQWFFLVCSTRLINERLGAQKSVGIETLEQLGLERLPFEQLAGAVHRAHRLE